MRWQSLDSGISLVLVSVDGAIRCSVMSEKEVMGSEIAASK